MNIAALNLKYYGPFTNKTLNFGDGNGLHILFGPNEAGKSTTLRALHNALFGFDTKEAERDAHVHDPKTLAIGISVRGGDGKQINVVRSRGRGVKSLVDADTGNNAPGLVLPVQDEEQFKVLFGIDYDRLVTGGRMLAAFKGDLGQAMLAAAGDTGEALELIASLDARCEALYKERGSASPLNKALGEYRDARRAINASRLTPAELTRLLNQIEQVRQEIEQGDEKLAAARLEQLNLDRLVNAVPHVHRLMENRKRLQGLGEIPVLALDFRQRYTAASERKREAEGQQRNAEAERVRLHVELGTLDRKPALAAIRGRLDTLNALAAKAMDAHEDIPKREAQKQEKENQKVALCQTLGITPDSVPAITLEEQTHIENLCTEQTVLKTKRDQLPGRIVQLQGALEQDEQELNGLPAPSDITVIRALLTDIPSAKRSGHELRRLRAQRDTDINRLQAELSALPLWTGTIDDLESSPIPLIALISSFEKRFAILDTAGDRLSEKQNRILQDKARLQADLVQLEGMGVIPTDAELQDFREERNQLWGHVRVAWQNGAWSAELASNYEIAVAKADSLVDQLKDEADAAAKKAQIVSRLDAAAVELSKFSEASAALFAERQSVGTDWVGSWPGHHIRPGRPAEMREWYDQRKRILEGRQSLRTLEQNISTGEAEESALRNSLASLLQRPSTDRLPELIAIAEAQIQASETVQNRRAELTGSIGKARRELNAALREQQELAAEWQGWSARWTDAVAKLPTNQTPDPALARQLLITIGEVNRLHSDIASLDYRITSMAQNRDELAAKLICVAAEIDQAAMAEADPQKTFKTLRQFADAAVQIESSAQELEKSIAHHAQQRERAERQIEATEELLRALAAEAGLEVGTGGIPALLDRHNDYSDLKELVKQDEEALRVSCANKSFECFVEEVASSDPDRLLVRLDQLELEVDELDRHTKSARERQQQLRHNYEEHSCSEVVSAAAARRELAAAQIEEHANEYAATRIKAQLLRKAIERYRDKHQDPLLQRVSGYFETLTCSRYKSVRIAQTDSARFLLGIRSDGKEVTVEGMSDGTRDQLFLALRLAHVANHCASAEPCPLILDDVLMAFDDARAMATIKALSELAGKTQVLLFTHHKHHVDLAREALGPDKFSLHELAA